jgi:hypothetical protein
MKAFATLLLAVGAPVASAQSYSFSYFYESVTFAPSAAPSVSPTGVPVPAPTLSPTISFVPTLSPTFCYDSDAGATDSYWDDCLGYAIYTSWCGNYDDDDFTSDEMCCGCGGGTNSVTAMPTPVPVPAPTGSWALGCTNTDGDALDMYDDSCDDWYFYTSRCPANGGWSYDDDDFTADDMCCACTNAGSAAPTPSPVVISVSLTVDIACADYGADEAAVFAAAMETTISGATVDADENDCTTISRRRNLLQTSSSELAFTVTISGADAATATATSIASVVSAAVSDGSFATALAVAVASTSYTGSIIPTDGSISVSGATAAFAFPPSPAPTFPPSLEPTAAPPAPTTNVLSGSWRSAPGMGLLGTCIVALAAAWI